MQEAGAEPEPREGNESRSSSTLLDSMRNKAVGEGDFEYFLSRFQELSAEHNGHIPLAPTVWGVFAERGIEGECHYCTLYNGNKTIPSYAEVVAGRINSLFKRVINNKLHEAWVHKIYYKTASGEWSENLKEGNWQPWCSSPGAALSCETRYEQYYIVGGVRYDDLRAAREAMAFELYKPYLFAIVLDIFKRLKQKEKRNKRMLSKLLYVNEVSHAR